MKLISKKDMLVFDNGSMLEYHHYQDCCESVYADFDSMQIITDVGKNSVDVKDLDFFEDLLKSIVPIVDLGFYIVTKQGICILVSCYNIQNGYYSSDLELFFKKDGKVETMDITDCTENGDGLEME